MKFTTRNTEYNYIEWIQINIIMAKNLHLKKLDSATWELHW